MEDFMRIKAESRNEVGKKISKKLRREGKIPAIIYGGKKETIPISLLLHDVKDVLKSEKGENTLLKIQRDDIEVDAMLKETQYDYLSNNIIHVDFIRIDRGQMVTVSVPVTVKGEAIGVKLEDGIFDFITREVRIKCLATKIPTEFALDVSGLHSGHSIKAEDLGLEEGIQLVSDPHTVICAVTSKSKAEVAAEEEEGVEVEAEAEETAENKPKPEAEEDKKE